MVIDTIGEILFFATFFTPVITVPVIWYTNKGDTKKWRIVSALLWALLLSILFFITSMGILLRNGMGPV
jgi:hypothetical protein